MSCSRPFILFSSLCSILITLFPSTPLHSVQFRSNFFILFSSLYSILFSSLYFIFIPIGYGPPCFPRNCCPPKVKITPNFIPVPPCINAPRGYQSDHFLFRLALDRTYMSTVQLFTSAVSSNVSTLHQEHVSLHQGAFNRINRCALFADDVVAPSVTLLMRCFYWRFHF